MQVVNPKNIVEQTNRTISSVAKNTSCSRGWLRVVMQCIFGGITITSFILIVYMAMGGGSKQNVTESRCTVNSCRVSCSHTPVFQQFENDIIFAVTEAGLSCDQVLLTLTEPIFYNSTIPEQWLSRIRVNVLKLEITGGNMKYIAPQAFMTQFAGNIQNLALEGITIMKWRPESLVGLSSLKEITIQNSNLIDIEQNALEAVDNTLKILSITSSSFWNPVNVTGSRNFEALSIVIFSSNNFNNILELGSFAGLTQCKILHLNSCRISAIGRGTFDDLKQIEMLYLNNNFLVATPTGLFDSVMALANPRPRISLQDNLWFCDCSSIDLHRLTHEGFLLVDTACYYPAEVRGQLFSDFLRNCNGSGLARSNTFMAESFQIDLNVIKLDGACQNGRHSNSLAHLISPMDFLSCPRSALVELFSSRFETCFSKPENDLLRGSFAMRGDYFSMIEITSPGPIVSGNYGLIWFQSECPDEIYCINTLPTYLRVYNIDDTAKYTFCPLTLSSGEVHEDKCIIYNVHDNRESSFRVALRAICYAFIILLCITMGACIVYALIRKFPHLLKGSDRILLVKHKNVDVLVLPPKLPLRSVNDDKLPADVNKDIFILSDSKVARTSLERTKSIRSANSIAPSYISALQPTEEQLTEWRLRQHFDNNMTITSVAFDLPYSLMSDDESIYCSISETSTKKYESL